MEPLKPLAPMKPTQPYLPTQPLAPSQPAGNFKVPAFNLVEQEDKPNQLEFFQEDNTPDDIFDPFLNKAVREKHGAQEDDNFFEGVAVTAKAMGELVARQYGAHMEGIPVVNGVLTNLAFIGESVDKLTGAPVKAAIIAATSDKRFTDLMKRNFTTNEAITGKEVRENFNINTNSSFLNGAVDIGFELALDWSNWVGVGLLDELGKIGRVVKGADNLNTQVIGGLTKALNPTVLATRSAKFGYDAARGQKTFSEFIPSVAKEFQGFSDVYNNLYHKYRSVGRTIQPSYKGPAPKTEQPINVKAFDHADAIRADDIFSDYGPRFDDLRPFASYTESTIPFGGTKPSNLFSERWMQYQTSEVVEDIGSAQSKGINYDFKKMSEEAVEDVSSESTIKSLDEIMEERRAYLLEKEELEEMLGVKRFKYNNDKIHQEYLNKAFTDATRDTSEVTLTSKGLKTKVKDLDFKETMQKLSSEMRTGKTDLNLNKLVSNMNDIMEGAATLSGENKFWLTRYKNIAKELNKTNYLLDFVDLVDIDKFDLLSSLKMMDDLLEPDILNVLDRLNQHMDLMSKADIPFTDTMINIRMLTDELNNWAKNLEGWYEAFDYDVVQGYSNAMLTSDHYQYLFRSAREMFVDYNLNVRQELYTQSKTYERISKWLDKADEPDWKPDAQMLARIDFIDKALAKEAPKLELARKQLVEKVESPDPIFALTAKSYNRILGQMSDIAGDDTPYRNLLSKQFEVVKQGLDRGDASFLSRYTDDSTIARHLSEDLSIIIDHLDHAENILDILEVYKAYSTMIDRYFKKVIESSKDLMTIAEKQDMLQQEFNGFFFEHTVKTKVKTSNTKGAVDLSKTYKPRIGDAVSLNKRLHPDKIFESDNAILVPKGDGTHRWIQTDPLTITNDSTTLVETGRTLGEDLSKLDKLEADLNRIIKEMDDTHYHAQNNKAVVNRDLVEWTTQDDRLIDFFKSVDDDLGKVIDAFEPLITGVPELKKSVASIKAYQSFLLTFEDVVSTLPRTQGNALKDELFTYFRAIRTEKNRLLAADKKYTQQLDKVNMLQEDFNSKVESKLLTRKNEGALKQTLDKEIAKLKEFEAQTKLRLMDLPDLLKDYDFLIVPYLKNVADNGLDLGRTIDSNFSNQLNDLYLELRDKQSYIMPQVEKRERAALEIDKARAGMLKERDQIEGVIQKIEDSYKKDLAINEAEAKKVVKQLSRARVEDGAAKIKAIQDKIDNLTEQALAVNIQKGNRKKAMEEFKAIQQKIKQLQERLEYTKSTLDIPTLTNRLKQLTDNHLEISNNIKSLPKMKEMIIDKALDDYKFRTQKFYEDASSQRDIAKDLERLKSVMLGKVEGYIWRDTDVSLEYITDQMTTKFLPMISNAKQSIRERLSSIFQENKRLRYQFISNDDAQMFARTYSSDYRNIADYIRHENPRIALKAGKGLKSELHLKGLMDQVDNINMDKKVWAEWKMQEMDELGLNKEVTMGIFESILERNANTGLSTEVNTESYKKFAITEYGKLAEELFGKRIDHPLMEEAMVRSSLALEPAITYDMLIKKFTEVIEIKDTGDIADYYRQVYGLFKDHEYQQWLMTLLNQSISDVFKQMKNPYTRSSILQALRQQHKPLSQVERLVELKKLPFLQMRNQQMFKSYALTKEYMKKNPHVRLVAITGEETPRIEYVTVTNIDSYNRVMKMNPMVLDYESAEHLKSMFKSDPFALAGKFEPALQVWRDWFVQIYKVQALMNVGFHINNLFDVIIKNTAQSGGGLLSAPRSVFDLIQSTHDAQVYRHKLSRVPYDELTSVEKKMFDELDGFFNTRAAGGSHFDDAFLKEWKSKQSKAEQWRQYILYDNGISRFNQKVGNMIEDGGRLALYRQGQRQGLSESRNLYRNMMSHYDYTNKPDAEKWAELIFPFTTFAIRNLMFWGDMMVNNPKIVENMYESIMMMYEEHGYDLENEELNSEWVGNQVARGNMPIENIMLKNGNSMLDAMRLVSDPVQNISNRIHPILKGDWDRVVPKPIDYALGTAKDVVKGDFDKAWKATHDSVYASFFNPNNTTAEKYFGYEPRMDYPDYPKGQRYYPNYTRSRSYTSFRMPRSYNFYKSQYTATGKSRLQMRLTPTNYKNLEYRIQK